MAIDEKLIAAAVEWDVINWSRAVRFWDIESKLKGIQKPLCLDIGARDGGLSLLFASCGCDVNCTDLINPMKSASVLHREYGVDHRVSYHALNALELCEESKYDIICFKSVLGGVGANDNYAAQKKMMDNIYRALKPGGWLFCAENLAATAVHQFLRRRFNAWSYWRYVTVKEMLDFCTPFHNVSYQCYGLLGAVGQTNEQRNFLARIDSKLDRFCNENSRYIISLSAQK
ncbi:class I SAM-dependent methyltransferase [Candidatus Avoscillospira sp. LCP25S3_F1]|uniref:class I SAM-dependent methyltransferase n=1 Tax=Candidatus Avoscillospira sp. LCP25S3_F1 TaxID=3438825 RepID=UPI003F93A001